MRLPGRGARPPPPAPRQDAPAAPPRWTSAPPGVWHPAGASTAALSPGALVSSLPGSLGCRGPAHWAARGDPRAGRAPSRPDPSGSLPTRPTLLKPGRGWGEPLHPRFDASPWPCPGPAALGPSSPRPGARPCPDGPALRTREGTRPLTRVALTHRPRFSSPPEPPPPALVATRHPGQVPSPEAPARALRDLAPGGLGGNPHAGHAPRGRASAPRRGERAGPSGQRAPRRLQRRGMRSARPFWGPFARWAVTLNQ